MNKISAAVERTPENSVPLFPPCEAAMRKQQPGTEPLSDHADLRPPCSRTVWNTFHCIQDTQSSDILL